MSDHCCHNNVTIELFNTLYRQQAEDWWGSSREAVRSQSR